MQKYKVAVIGCGGRSQAHIKAYQHIEAAQVVACCDLNRKRADERAAEFKLKAYADAGEMLALEKPDLVHVITAPNVRLELLTLVSDAGVPACTVEKPLATGVADWRALCELERKTRTKIAVCHQFRWQSHLVKCREALKTMGPVKFLEFSAGMNISGQGTHILNYGMSLNGDAPVTRVFGAASGTSEFDTMHPAPDQTAGYLTFANGVRALWNNGPAAPRCGDPSTVWQHVRVAAFADRGRITWEEFGAWEIVGPGGEERGA